MPTIFLGLGSNLGDRRKNIGAALEELQKHGITIQKISSIIETEPLGGPAQGKFLNAAVKAQTTLSPHELLTTVKTIEKTLGRTDTGRWGPRPIDIDILLYGDEKISTPELTIPHPRMKERDFVMQPLGEVKR